MHRPACCDHVRLSRRWRTREVATLAACTTRLESRCGIWSGVHRSGGVPMQLRAVRVLRQGPDDADMSMTACLQQGDPLFVQPLSELFAGMTEAVESTAGSHHQPGSYGCQKVRLEGTVRAVVRRQQDIGLHVLTAGQQVAQGGRIGITGKQGQTVPVPDKAQDQGGPAALQDDAIFIHYFQHVALCHLCTTFWAHAAWAHPRCWGAPRPRPFSACPSHTGNGSGASWGRCVP